MMSIVCSTDEVLAILDERKRVTQLVIKPQPKKVRYGMWCWEGCKWTDDKTSFSISGMEDYAPCQPGDILYVQEEWQEKRGGGYRYKADTVHSFDLFITPDGQVVGEIPWRPADHMPKEAARIFLQVTDVRAERLQDGFSGPICPLIEAEAVGIDMIGQFCQICKAPCQQCPEYYGELCPLDTVSAGRTNVLECGMLDCLRDKFSKIWDLNLNPADRDLYGWAANPFVWYVVFEHIIKDEAIGH